MLFSCPLHLKCLLLNTVKFTCHFGIKGEGGRGRAKIIGFFAKWCHSPCSLEVIVKAFIAIFVLIASIFVDILTEVGVDWSWVIPFPPSHSEPIFVLLTHMPAAGIMPISSSPAFCPTARRHDSAVRPDELKSPIVRRQPRVALRPRVPLAHPAAACPADRLHHGLPEPAASPRRLHGLRTTRVPAGAAATTAAPGLRAAATTACSGRQSFRCCSGTVPFGTSARQRKFQILFVSPLIKV